jgi:phosphohistidine swiveling domain-containing protein
MRHPSAEPKWTLPESTNLSRLTREAVFSKVQKNLKAMGDDVAWSDVVNTRTMELLSPEDGAKIADDVWTEFQMVEGRKLYAGCEVAVKEQPDRYVLRSDAMAAQESVADLPEGAVADGDNAFRADDLEGTVLVIREVSEVDRLMREGVPEGAIGVIDDAGGTMTAPILEEFEGVLCLAGTVRSHLAIISREFGVPVLMGVRMARALKTGERVRVQYSADAQNVDAYFGDEVKPRAIVTLLEDPA